MQVLDKIRMYLKRCTYKVKKQNLVPHRKFKNLILGVCSKDTQLPLFTSLRFWYFRRKSPICFGCVIYMYKSVKYYITRLWAIKPNSTVEQMIKGFRFSSVMHIMKCELSLGIDFQIKHSQCALKRTGQTVQGFGIH